MNGSDAGVIAIDWGTTNRRVYNMNSLGDVEARRADAQGILAIPAGGFPSALAELRRRVGERPMLLAGMIGSNRGWVETPYLRCPAGIDELAAAIKPTEDPLAWIVPGVCYDEGDHADVMRGEEVQLLGAVAAGLIPPDARACHPGTHAKWVTMEGGAIRKFRTVMTGELFALLRKHSILADQLRAEATVGAAFRDGVRHGLADPSLSADLFTVRARILLGKLDPADAASYVSGLLIGSDVRIGLAFLGGDGDVALIGEGVLTALYAAALAEAGLGCHEIDGEAAFLAGIHALAERLP